MPADGSASLDFAAPALVRVNSLVPFFLPGVTGVTGERETTFMSFEVNGDVYRSDRVRVLAGLRGLSIDDDMTLNIAGSLDSVLTQNVSNRLIGPQIGGVFQLYDSGTGGFRVTASGRLGMMQNKSKASSVMDTGVVVVEASGSHTEWTPMVEVGLDAIWNVAENCTVSLGYSLFYFDKLASSPDSLIESNYFTGEISSTYDSVMYHGLRLEAVVKF